MKEIREKILRASYNSKEGHIPSSLSILDILWVLYDKILKFDISNPNSLSRDYFILSKGHASLGLYAILEEKGLLKEGSINEFCFLGSNLGGHPDRNKIPYVEASTGSLGHGFPIAVGLALGHKILNNSNKTYIIVGDGECNEGTIWESALLCSHHNLSNLYCIVDYNHSTDRALSIGNVSDKFKSFGWNVININGHNQNEIYNALIKTSDKPTAIIAETIKGYGIKSIENNWAWHHKSAQNEDELNLLIKEIYL